MSGDLKGLFKVGYDVLASSISPKTKKVLLQIGSVVGQTVDSDAVEQIQHYGFTSRMPRPDPGKTAAQVVVLCTGSRDIAIASQDLRGLELYGSLDYGEVAIYSAGEDGKGQARITLKKNGSVNLYTRKGNVDTGAGMLIQIDAIAGKLTMINDKGYGLVVDQDGVKMTAGDAGLAINGDGSIKMIGKSKVQIDGSSILLGSKAAPVVNAALVGPTGLAGVASTKVLIALA